MQDENYSFGYYYDQHHCKLNRIKKDPIILKNFKSLIFESFVQVTVESVPGLGICNRGASNGKAAEVQTPEMLEIQ